MTSVSWANLEDLFNTFEITPCTIEVSDKVFGMLRSTTIGVSIFDNVLGFNGFTIRRAKSVEERLAALEAKIT